jgi:hypothetical protein
MSSKQNADARDDWQTPTDLRDDIRDFAEMLGFGGITLDPATSKANPMLADRIRTEDCDPGGLTTAWFEKPGPTFVYVNPPYKAQWYRKIISETQLMREDCHVVSLIPAKPGTGYFQDIAAGAGAIVFIRGRITFEDPKTGKPVIDPKTGKPTQAPFESALIYHGDRPARFISHFQHLGWSV